MPLTIIIGLSLVLSLLSVACSKSNDPEQAQQPEMVQSFNIDGPHWRDIDPELQAAFTEAHEAVETEDRPVFEQYLPEIGPVADHATLVEPVEHDL